MHNIPPELLESSERTWIYPDLRGGPESRKNTNSVRTESGYNIRSVKQTCLRQHKYCKCPFAASAESPNREPVAARSILDSACNQQGTKQAEIYKRVLRTNTGRLRAGHQLVGLTRRLVRSFVQTKHYIHQPPGAAEPVPMFEQSPRLEEQPNKYCKLDPFKNNNEQLFRQLPI